MAEAAVGVELDAQYRVLREEAGLLWRERGHLVVRGPEAADYLQGQLTNDVAALGPGDGCYAALLDPKGHLQADLRILRVAAEELWLDTEPALAEVLTKHLGTYKIGREVELDDVCSERSLLSVIGPAAGEVTGTGSISPEHAHREVDVDGVTCRAVATDLGIDLLCSPGEAEPLTATLTRAGAEEVGEAAAEILRVESGRPRFGFEMSEATMPAEAGITERAVSFTKGCYIGQEPVARLHYKGRPNRHLRGLRLSAPASPGEALRLGDREVGAIATACISPTLGPIALAIVRREAGAGEVLAAGDGEVTAEVVELPFRA
jgi:folate-binding protein YgfZ